VPLHLHWFLPTAGDSHDVVGFGPATGDRPPTLQYLTEVAVNAERLGFDGVLTPVGSQCTDPWIATAALIGVTRRLRFIVAVRTGSASPTLVAQQAAGFQQLSGGRVVLNVVTGGDPEEQGRYGDWLDHDARYARTDEFLTVIRGSWGAVPFDFDGDHVHVAGATAGLDDAPVPPIFFGGASPAALRVAARHADVHLSWGETADQLAPGLARMREVAAEHDRRLRFGVRLHVITRDRARDAWAVTDRLLDAMPPALIARAQREFAKSQSVAQQRMMALHNGRTDDLIVGPNLWAGFGLVRGGAGTALVGSHEEVAERLVEYHRAGFDHVILSGQPHVEEASWFGEGVMPLLAREGLLAGSAPEPALAGTR
jgi:alkanesulfonate monooxygenase